MPHRRVRVGIGFDSHQFIIHKGKKEVKIMLCGVPVPCKYSISAHSDGDVALHALTDALLGAISEGDIGMHFPSHDLKWKNASSDQFVAFAKNMIASKGGVINNVDVTIIAQTPKISLYREAFRNRIASILSIEPSYVSVKATTTDKMGFTGREEGLAAQAVATIIL